MEYVVLKKMSYQVMREQGRSFYHLGKKANLKGIFNI